MRKNSRSAEGQTRNRADRHSREGDAGRQSARFSGLEMPAADCSGRPITPSPLMGEGRGGGDANEDRSAMKKQPSDGAHERARTLRREMTEAEKELWHLLRSRQ